MFTIWLLFTQYLAVLGKLEFGCVPSTGWCQLGSEFLPTTGRWGLVVWLPIESPHSPTEVSLHRQRLVIQGNSVSVVLGKLKSGCVCRYITLVQQLGHSWSIDAKICTLYIYTYQGFSSFFQSYGVSGNFSVLFSIYLTLYDFWVQIIYFSNKTINCLPRNKTTYISFSHCCLVFKY